MAMSELAPAYLDRFVTWGRAERAVRAVILLGSRAGRSLPDPLSDIDLLVITTRRRRLSSLEWLEAIPPAPVFSFTYRSPIGGQAVSQAVYEGPLVVDIALVSRAQALLTSLTLLAVSRLPPVLRMLSDTAIDQLDAWRAIAARGAEVLVDKDGVGTRMVRHRGHTAGRPSTEGAFLNTVHSFFGLTLWESKQLVRNELWMALGTVDQQVKQCLLAMFEWHTRSRHDRPVETWYGGRKVEDWADPRWSEALKRAWPRYDTAEAWDALLSTFELFAELARETAGALGYRYPADEERTTRRWIAERRPSSGSGTTDSAG